MKRGSKRKTRRRSQSKGISVIGLAETYLLLNATTQALFRNNPYDFLVGGRDGTAAQGSAKITLSELMDPSGRFYNNPQIPGSGTAPRTTYIMQNIKKQWIPTAISFVTIPLAFRFGKALARPAITRTNNLLKKGKIANTVKL